MDESLAGHGGELFEQLMRGTHAGVALLGPDGRFLRVNPALCRFLGRTPQELRLSTWQELTHPDDVQIDLRLVDEILSGKREEYRLRKRYLRPGGEVLWGDLSVSCLRDGQGHVVCLISQILDVTPLVRTQHELRVREQHYRLVVESSRDVMVMTRPDGTIDWISNNVEHVCGYRAAELIGRNALDVVIHPNDRIALRDRLAQAVRSAHPTTTVFALRCKDGSSVWMEAAGQNTAEPSSGQPVRVVRWRNVDAEYRAMQRLRASEQLFRTAMEASAVGMATLSLERQFTRVNRALCQMLQRDEQWLLGHGIADLVDATDNEADLALRRSLHDGEKATASVDKKLRRGGGDLIDVRHGIGLLRDEEGRPTGYVSQFIDMTEVNRARNAVEFLAAHDPLTHVHNRRGIFGGLEAMLGHPNRSGNRIGVVYADLDSFKPLNDRFGHAFGDRVLEAVAARLRSSVRVDDLVGRLGGDEFIIVLSGLHGGGEVARIIETLRCKIAEPLLIDGKVVTLTASLGVVLADPGEDAESVVGRADAALYRSKRAGGNRFTIA